MVGSHGAGVLSTQPHRRAARLVEGILAVLVAALICLLAGSRAVAQGEGTTIFLVAESVDPELTRALETASTALRSQLTGTGRYRFAASRDMEAVVSQCREQVATSAVLDRECQLQAARVAAMDHLLVLTAQALGDRTEVLLRVVEPGNNEEIFAASEVAAGEPHAAVGDAVRLLAMEYDRWMTGADVLDVCYEPPRNPEPAIAEVDVGAVLEVLGTTPETVSVSVNGDHVGFAPGQFFGLPGGLVTIELSADGCQTTDVEVSLVEGEVVTIEDVELGFLPGQLTIAANIAGVTVFVDGREVGRILREPIQVDLMPGEHRVEVRREGYATFAATVSIAPGAARRVDAVLSPRLCGNHIVEGGEQCDDGNTFDGDGCSARCEMEQPRLEVACGVAGADVRVAGRLVGRTGSQGAASVAVPEGRHRVEVRAPGYRDSSRTLTFQPGRVTRADVVLIEESRGGSAAPWVMLAGGIALVAGGLVMDLVHLSDLDELDELRSQCTDTAVGGECASEDLERGTELSGELGDAKLVSGILYGVGAAASVAGLIWGLVRSGGGGAERADLRRRERGWSVNQSGAVVGVGLQW